MLGMQDSRALWLLERAWVTALLREFRITFGRDKERSKTLEFKSLKKEKGWNLNRLSGPG